MSLVEKTKAMIDALPDEGACVVTLTNEFARWVRRKTAERRGDDFASRCRFVGIHQMRSVAKLIGERRRVVAHHSFEERAKSDVKAEVDRIASACSAMHPD